MKILFSDEKLFDISMIYYSQNDRTWVVNRSEADIKCGTRQIKGLWFDLERVLKDFRLY